MPVASTWLTAPRVRRIAQALGAIPDRSPGVLAVDAPLRLWRACGGPIEDIGPLVDVIVHAELAHRDQASLRLTPAGRRALARQRAEGHRPVALALLRSGLLHDQARRFLDSFPANSDDTITCRAAHARKVAPQLLGLLQHWPDLRGHTITVPQQLVAELGAVWALLSPPPTERAEADARRWSIGKRAELYSYQLERLNATSASTIVWVAQDDDNLGYDIEDRSTNPRRRIEVKGSGGREVRFFLTANEWRKAHTEPGTYEIQFWGGIDLNRSAADEYHTLRSEGYPIVFPHVADLLDTGILDAAPDRWRITHPAAGEPST